MSGASNTQAYCSCVSVSAQVPLAAELMEPGAAAAAAGVSSAEAEPTAWGIGRPTSSILWRFCSKHTATDEQQYSPDDRFCSKHTATDEQQYSPDDPRSALSLRSQQDDRALELGLVNATDRATYRLQHRMLGASKPPHTAAAAVSHTASPHLALVPPPLCQSSPTKCRLQASNTKACCRFSN
jgi:hypothetical protein